MPTNPELLQRITARPGVFGGKPIIRDLRIAVEHVLGMLAAGDSAETILREYPILEPQDIRACTAYARGHRKRHAVPPRRRESTPPLYRSAMERGPGGEAAPASTSGPAINSSGG